MGWLWGYACCKQCPPYMGAKPEYYVFRSGEKCCVCSNFRAMGHEEGWCAGGKSHAGCRMSYCVAAWREGYCGSVLCNLPDRCWCEKLYEGMMCFVCITCRLTLWASKHGFSQCDVGKLWCASICCVKRTMRKCLKISVKTLLIQIFFVYLPAFMRVTPSCARWATWVKSLKESEIECNKAEIDNF